MSASPNSRLGPSVFAETILVSLDRLRRCPQEIGSEFWPPDSGRRKKTTRVAGQEVNTDNQPEPVRATSDTRSVAPRNGVKQLPSGATTVIRQTEPVGLATHSHDLVSVSEVGWLSGGRNVH